MKAKNQIEAVIKQANLLGSLEQGITWFVAARLIGVPEGEVAAVAEIACFQHLNQEINDPKLAAARMKRYQELEALEDGVQSLVAAWVRASGKLRGGGGSQSRQNKRRTLRKHGLSSAYADKMRAEIAALTAIV